MSSASWGRKHGNKRKVSHSLELRKRPVWPRFATPEALLRSKHTPELEEPLVVAGVTDTAADEDGAE